MYHWYSYLFCRTTVDEPPIDFGIAPKHWFIEDHRSTHVGPNNWMDNPNEWIGLNDVRGP